MSSECCIADRCQISLDSQAENSWWVTVRKLSYHRRISMLHNINQHEVFVQQRAEYIFRLLSTCVAVAVPSRKRLVALLCSEATSRSIPIYKVAPLRN